MSAIDRLPPSATTTVAGAKGPDADLRILDDVQPTHRGIGQGF